MNILMTTADHLMIDRRILQQARTLVAHGHQVTLLAGFECPQRQSYVEDGVRIERFVYDWGDSRFAPWMQRLGLRPGSRVHAWAWRLFRGWASRLAALNSFEQFVHDRMSEYQADILHVHDFPMLAPAVQLARRHRLALIYDAHELYYAKVQLPRSVQRRYRKREARLIGQVDAAITVNPYIARLMAERYSVPAPHVILNAAPLAVQAPPGALRGRFGLPPNARIVLYQGWISDNRGIERLVEAAQLFDRDTYLVLVGYGAYEDALKARVESLGLQGRVLFYGGVPSAQLHELTCDADLGVIPYHGVDENNFYCSPNKLFEFAIAELPFVCNDLPFLRDVVQAHGNGLLADLGSPRAIAQAVNAVFADPAGLTALRAGAARAKATLNWEVEASKLLQIYQRVLG